LALRSLRRDAVSLAQLEPNRRLIETKTAAFMER